jgi:hypothetical protein
MIGDEVEDRRHASNAGRGARHIIFRYFELAIAQRLASSTPPLEAPTPAPLDSRFTITVQKSQ